MIRFCGRPCEFQLAQFTLNTWRAMTRCPQCKTVERVVGSSGFGGSVQYAMGAGVVCLFVVTPAQVGALHRLRGASPGAQLAQSKDTRYHQVVLLWSCGLSFFLCGVMYLSEKMAARADHVKANRCK